MLKKSTRNFYSEARYLYLDEKKKQTWQALIMQRRRAT